ncbi:MAG: hypothetical protein ACRDWW_06630, partial [Acidimicrobiales bacterium]
MPTNPVTDVRPVPPRPGRWRRRRPGRLPRSVVGAVPLILLGSIGVAGQPAAAQTPSLAPAAFGTALASASPPPDSPGAVAALGMASSLGGPGASIAKPVVGVAGTPDKRGYWLAAADGGVFSFGDAGFHGSLGGTHLDAPVVGIAATPDGHGYWLAGADGGVFS